MKSSTSLTRQIFIALSMSMALSVTLPAWSDVGEKPSLKDAVEKDVSIGDDDKGRRDRKGSKNDDKDRSAPGEGTVKKKVIKQAGVAAAAGVVGKKVTSKFVNNKSD